MGRRINRYGAVALAALVVLVAVGVTLTVRAVTAGPTLADAYDSCGQAGSLGDDGSTLTLEGYGEAFEALFEYSDEPEELEAELATLGLVSVEDISCVLLELDVPDSVVGQIDTTRALDGMRDAAWDGFEASWTYHPDDGLNLIVTEVD